MGVVHGRGLVTCVDYHKVQVGVPSAPWDVGRLSPLVVYPANLFSVQFREGNGITQNHKITNISCKNISGSIVQSRHTPSRLVTPNRLLCAAVPQMRKPELRGQGEVRCTGELSLAPAHPNSINGPLFIVSSCCSPPAPRSSSWSPRSSGKARLQAPRRGGCRALRRCWRKSPCLS